ncbi:hypothetical protein Moror_16559 [Moniliophthora roreri MCA 2997]|uniref:Uncharacterized protein n=1 Tax=Moniliophthora roreri (strain MCA 2997) TaxID=1381753 RepID=V2WII4_MONRO|nr:hypothetical protein Moror_16559 [Moniliophthora roreri MCA 2997]
MFKSACSELKLTPEKCEEFLKMEVEYFNWPIEVPENKLQDGEYVGLLNKLWAAEKESNDAHKEWKKLSTKAARSWMDKQIQSIKACNSSTFKKLGMIQEEITCFKDDYGIYP